MACAQGNQIIQVAECYVRFDSFAVLLVGNVSAIDAAFAGLDASGDGKPRHIFSALRCETGFDYAQ